MDEENINVFELVLDTLNRDDLWFTQKTDPTYQEASSYYELDEFGDPTEKTIKKIEKEVNSLIGDGAIDIIDAVELWKNDQIAEFRLDFRDNLVTKFEPKPVVDNIKAYENSVQFPQSKKIEAKIKKTEEFWEDAKVYTYKDIDIQLYISDRGNKLYSILNGQEPFSIPDFTTLKDAKKYIDDNNLESYKKRQENKEVKTEGMINLSADDKQKYYIGKGIVGGQATPYDLYKIDNKYYNANGLEISEKDALDDMDNFKHIFGDKKTEDYDVDTYNKEQAELKREYRDRIVKSITPEIKNAFNDLRDLLDEGEDKTELDGFYFPSDAITVVDMADKAYHLNSAMDLTTSNILNMVGNNDTIEQAIDELFADYDAESAYSWADNFITVLGKLDFDLHSDDENDVYTFEVSLPDCDPLMFTADWSEEAAVKEYMENEGSMSKYTVDDISINYLDEPIPINENKKYEKGTPITAVTGGKSSNLNVKESLIKQVEAVSFGKALRELKTEAKQDKIELTPEQKANKIANIGSLVGKAKYPFQLNAVVHTLSFVDQDLSNKLRQTFNPATIKQDGIEDARNGIAQMIFDETGVDVLAPNMEFATESKNVNFNKCTKDKKDENYQRRLEEVNNKSANTIKDILQSDGFDSESNAGKIVLRTQDLFTALSDLGLDVDVTFDNGDSTSTIQLGTAGGKVVITINDPEKPLKAFMSGNVELTGDSLEKFQSIEDRIKTV